MEGSKPSIGESLKDTQKGHLPIGTVEQILAAAPNDIVEEVVDIPEWGVAVRLRSFTAAQSSRIKTVGFAFEGDNTNIAWADMEKAQFMEGCKEPVWDEQDITKLHITSGRGFARVIKWLDQKSSIDKEALKEAQDDFRKSHEQAEVRVLPGEDPGKES